MSTIKLNELATSNIALTDFIAKADANGLMTKNTISNLSKFFETVGEVGFKGSVLIADNPTADGWYLAGEIGVFPNIGNLEALSESVTIFVISGSDTIYSKIDIPLTGLLTFKAINIGVNSENDSTVTGSLLTGGTNPYPNKLGVNNTKPIDNPTSYTRSNDTAYVSGSADVSTVLAGYDNVNNALAGIIESQHSMLYYGATHSSIHGGSLHTIKKDAGYSTIISGTDNVIEELCSYAAIIGGERCKILTGADIVSSGFRSVILGSLLSQVSNRNGLILGGENVNIQAKYASSINSFNSTIYNGIHTLIVGNTIKIGENTVSNYSTAIGVGIEINGSYSHAKGNGHIIDNIFVNAIGESCKSSFNGANLESSRQRGDVAGNNMALRWSASQETTDTTTTRLSTYGSSEYPKQPDNTIVTGTVHVTGVDDSGECSTYIIDFTTQKIGTSNPVLKASTVSTIYDGLSLPTAPTINTTSSGIYRVQVVGLAATNIRWEASFNGHQIVFN